MDAVWLLQVLAMLVVSGQQASYLADSFWFHEVAAGKPRHPYSFSGNNFTRQRPHFPRHFVFQGWEIVHETNGMHYMPGEEGLHDSDHFLEIKLRVKAVHTNGFDLQWNEMRTRVYGMIEVFSSGGWRHYRTFSTFGDSHNVRGLFHGTRYRAVMVLPFRSNEVQVTTSARTPIGLNVRAVGPSTAFLNWGATGELNTIEVDVFNGTKYEFQEHIADIDVPEWTLRGLLPNTQYRMRVKTAVNGVESQFTKYKEVKTLEKSSIPVPYNLETQAYNETCAEVSWKVENELAEEDLMFWLAAFVSDVSATPITETNATHGVLEGLSPDTRYNIRARSLVTRDGIQQFSSWSFLVAVRTQKKLNAPYDLKLVKSNQTSIEFSWKYRETKGTGKPRFNVEVHKVGEPLNSIDYALGNASGLISVVTSEKLLKVKNLTAHTEYDIRIYASATANDGRTFYSDFSHHLRVLTSKGNETSAVLLATYVICIVLLVLKLEFVACFLWRRRRRMAKKGQSNEMRLNGQLTGAPSQEL